MLHDQKKSIKLLAIILVIIGSVVESLKLSQVVVPQVKRIGETATLECVFQLGTDRLYAVKWYKDNEEFYRYVPKYSPPNRDIPVNGVHVRLSGSDSQQVMLHKLDLRSTGVYRCEVSAEGPSFSSVQGGGRMTVVHLPVEGPQISGTVYEEYEVGDVLQLNCSSSESYPPTRLSWYINDQPIKSDHIKTISPPDGLPLNSVTSVMRSVSQLTLPLAPNHFEGGSAKVRCVASIFALYWQDGDEKVLGGSLTGSPGGGGFGGGGFGMRDPRYDLRSSPLPRIIDDMDAFLVVRGGESSAVGTNVLLLNLITLFGLLLFHNSFFT